MSDEHTAPPGTTEANAPGTGGLTLEAPSPDDITALPIGFAPDLDDNVDANAGWSLDGPAPQTRRPLPSNQPPPLRTPHFSPVDDGDYPLARAVLSRLLGAVEPAPPITQPSPQDAPRADETAIPAPASAAPDSVAPDDHTKGEPLPPDAPLAAFAVGQQIMKPPPAIVTPPPPKPEVEPDTAQTQMEDMVDVVLVGSPESGDHEIHLMFKEDVLRGLYLRLERREDGLFAHFTVADDTTRRAIEGEIDTLLSRLRSRGMKIAGHAVALKKPDA